MTHPINPESSHTKPTTPPRGPAGISKVKLHSISFTNHPFHGPWNCDSGVCRGCGTIIVEGEDG